ncbi:hypothetical protein VNO80_17809 [Phaseolus coccineus]|uniref:Uroporphyrinogen-III synthase n=1 Tax=Phaseolus coccineus TaxID=3886 RepID=A0AAN9MGG3_PHACN
MHADNAFDWVLITSPEATSVFLEAWRSGNWACLEDGLSKRGFEVPVEQIDHMVLKLALAAPVVTIDSPSVVR